MIITDLPSPNVDERPGGTASIDVLMLHYTGMQTAQAAIDRLRDPAAEVSSHYIVDEDGSVLRLVPEHLRARHAGISYWRGRRALNDTSIGIEIVNPGHEWGYRPFPPVQMAAVRTLCLGILSRHAIPARNVVGHSDVAPNRKQDPGELFDWRGLAADGIGVWPQVDEIPTQGLVASLLQIGYEFGNGTDIAAFQRHWRSESVTGVADDGTLTVACSLARMSSTVRIYVPLLNDGVDVLRPVQAILLPDGTFRVCGAQDHDEVWAFPPGTVVQCRRQEWQECGRPLELHLIAYESVQT